MNKELIHTYEQFFFALEQKESFSSEGVNPDEETWEIRIE
jgi:hypothetical protein